MHFSNSVNNFFLQSHCLTEKLVQNACKRIQKITKPEREREINCKDEKKNQKRAATTPQTNYLMMALERILFSKRKKFSVHDFLDVGKERPKRTERFCYEVVVVVVASSS